MIATAVIAFAILLCVTGLASSDTSDGAWIVIFVPTAFFVVWWLRAARRTNRRWRDVWLAAPAKLLLVALLVVLTVATFRNAAETILSKDKSWQHRVGKGAATVVTGWAAFRGFSLIKRMIEKAREAGK